MGREGERDEAALMKDPSYVLVLAVEDVNDPIDHLGPEPTCGNLWRRRWFSVVETTTREDVA